MHSSLNRKLNLLTILIFTCIYTYAGKINFVSLSNFNDKKAVLKYYNQDSTVFDSTTTTVDRSEACFTIPDGEWNLSLSLPNYILLRYKNVKSDSDLGSKSILSFSGVYISGELPSSLNLGSYIIDNDIYISSQSTAILPEGTSFFFNEATQLKVMGQLIVQGSENLPVIFRNNNNHSNWNGIVFKDSPLSILNYCSIINSRLESIIADNSLIESQHLSINRSSNYVQTADSSLSIIKIINQSNIELYKADINGARFPVTNSVLFIENSGATINESIVHNLFTTKGSIISCNAGSLNINNCVLSNKQNGEISSILCTNCTANNFTISNTILYNSSNNENAQGIYFKEAPFTTTITNNIIYNTKKPNNSNNTHLDDFGINISPNSFIDKYGNIFDQPFFQDSISYRLSEETALIKNLASVQILEDSPIPVPTNYIGVHKYLMIDAENFFSSWSSIPTDTDIFFDAGENYFDGNFLNDDTIRKRYFLLKENDNITINEKGNKSFSTGNYILPIVSAGETNYKVCENGSVILYDAWAKHYTSLKWTTEGDGVFDNISKLHPRYIPGNNDVKNGFVKVTLTAYNGSSVLSNPHSRIVEIQKFKPVLANSHRMTTCSDDSVTIQTISGESFSWSTGSTDDHITVKPSFENYGLTVTDGVCTKVINSIMVAKVKPYLGGLTISQNFDSVHFKLNGVLYPETTELTWLFDNGDEYTGNDFHLRFIEERQHSLCVDLAEDSRKCYETICRDFEYNLAKDSIGGQIYIGKYPVVAAEIHIFRYFNGDFIPVDTLKTDKNGFFYQTDLPIGYYTVKAELLPNDPSYNDGYYGGTYLGNKLDINKATIIAHTTSNTWGQNIQLQVDTPTEELSTPSIKLIPSNDYRQIRIISDLTINSIQVVSMSGAISFMAKDIQSLKYSINTSNLSSGIYHINTLLKSGELYTHKIIIP